MALSDMRYRRNSFAHEGYNEMFALAVGDVEDDIKLMLSITVKVEAWRQEIRRPNADGSYSFKISPAIFGMYLQIVKDIAETKLAITESLPDKSFKPKAPRGSA